MENSLVVLIFVASIIYKIYTSYKEEMDKAAKRNPKKVLVPAPPVVNPASTTSAKPAQIPYYSQEKEIRNPFQDIPSEVKRVQESKILQQSKRASVNQPKLSSVSNKVPRPSFDLRQAVIQAAILDRPYK
mgnify:CR=1 FL=1